MLYICDGRMIPWMSTV